MPTKNGQIRINDVSYVIARYRHDQGGTVPPLYDPLADHSFVGPNPWNLGPGDGLIRINDVSEVIASYRTDCPVTLPATYTQLTYDDENRLSTRTQGGITTTYVYDGQGSLAKKVVQGGATTLYVDGLYEDTGGTITKYYSFNGRRVAMDKDGTRSFLLADHLGSTTTVLNSSGSVVSSEKYYPFGNTRGTPTVGTDKQFTGHQKEGDLYFMKARFYDPAVGRFLQPDSIVPDPNNPQALNRYSYAYNNPLLYTDPTGHFGWDDVKDTVTNNPVSTTIEDTTNKAKDFVVDHRDVIVPLAACGAGFAPACGAALYCGVAGNCDDIASGVANLVADCWQSDTCRTVAVSIGVLGCTSLSGGTVAAGCTAAGLTALSYDDALDCIGGETGGCINVGINVGIELGSAGLGRVIKRSRVLEQPMARELGFSKKSFFSKDYWRFAPFGNGKSRIPHFHRPGFVLPSWNPRAWHLDREASQFHRPWSWLGPDWKGP